VATTNPPIGSQNLQEFYFRGNAVAAGGFLTRLGGKPIVLDPERPTVHGESTLPLIGGVSRSSVPNPPLSFPDHISYANCTTFVEGRYDGNETVTTLRASVSSVRLNTSPSPSDNVPNVKSITFQAGSFSIEVESRSARTGTPQVGVKPTQPPDMALVITDNAGKVTTYPIKLEFDEHFLSLATQKQLDEEFTGNQSFFDEFARRFHSVENLVFGKSTIPRAEHGSILGSFVKVIHVGDEVIRGNVLTRKGFGTIQFGITVVNPFGRRFAMAHIKMGSDPGGDVDLCAVEDTGIWK